MLAPAIKYENQLIELFRNTWFNDDYKYLSYDSYFTDQVIEHSTFLRHQFVSIDSKGNVLGFIDYQIDRESNMCYRLMAVNFSNNKVVFGRDLVQAIDDIFMKFNFNKLRFSVIMGNPIESSYDRIVNEAGGQIVGIFKEEARLSDGKMYDVKNYEIMRHEYLNYVNSKLFERKE